MEKAGELTPAFSMSGAEGTRTPDPLHAMQVRYQLRHSPVEQARAYLQEVLTAKSAPEIG